MRNSESYTELQWHENLHIIKVTNKSNHLLHMLGTAARHVGANLEFCKSRIQTQ